MNSMQAEKNHPLHSSLFQMLNIFNFFNEIENISQQITFWNFQNEEKSNVCFEPFMKIEPTTLGQ